MDNRAALEAVEPHVLAEVVRAALGRPAFEIGQWSTRVLSNRGFLTPDGLWLVSGDGHDDAGLQPWSVVVKMLKGEQSDLEVTKFYYWQREALLAQSGLTETLPGRVRAPRFYRVDERPEGAWVWMEHVVEDRPGPWSLADYAFVARQLGRWNGTYLAGRPLPTEPWQAQRHARSMAGFAKPETEWQFPLLLKHCSAERRRQYDQLWAERELFAQVVETLPQTWSHFDIQPRNMLRRTGADGEPEVVLVDWAFCGQGPVGAEAGELVGVSCLLLEWPPTALRELEAAALAAYRQGLVEAGWPVDETALRAGYTAWLALWSGLTFPGYAIWLCSPDNREFSLGQFGLAEEDLFLKMFPLLEYALDCAEEARRLMPALGLRG